MARPDHMGVTFRGRAHMRKFEELAEREMYPTYYANSLAMNTLGLKESVLYLLNQIGWETTPILRQYVTYRRLTLEFLSSLVYLPHHGKGITRGMIRFRLFNMEHQYNIREFATLLGFPTSIDTLTETQEDLFEYRELDYFWGSLTGNDDPEEHEFRAESIHNPAFRYFHKILAHTLFGKKQNFTQVSRDELFIIFCASQNRPVNGAAYMLANFTLIAQDTRAPILIGGLVTMIANAIGLHQPLLCLNPYGGIQPMNINFLFNSAFIANLGPHEFTLLINNQPVHLFTLPSPMTSVHNRNNWFYNLDGPPSPARTVETIQDYEIPDDPMPDAESDPETPTDYHVLPSPPRHVPDAESTTLHYPPIPRPHQHVQDHDTVVRTLMTEHETLREELTVLRNDFFAFMSVVSA